MADSKQPNYLTPTVCISETRRNFINKQIFYSICYGMSPTTLLDQLKQQNIKLSLEEIKQFYEKGATK